MVTLSFANLFEGTYSDAHFGGNILATRDGVGEDGTFDEAADRLGLTSIRYPGGSLTERYFDITDPNRLLTEHEFTDDDQPLLPFNEFMAFAASTGRSALIVLPTRFSLSQETDARGDRYAQVDEDALRTFVRDTLDGVYGNPQIAGFELGNEYWDSGEMNSVEYGRVASAMARIVDDELNNHPEYEERFQDTQILVQMGLSCGYAGLEDRYEGTAQEQLTQFMAEYGLNIRGDFIYANGTVAWPKLSNYLVQREFDTPEEVEAVDGIVAHVYSRGEDATSSHTFALRTLDSTWAEEFPDAEIAVTEWNIRNRGRDEEEDYGLTQAGEMLDLVEAFGLYDVASAYVYPVQQRNPGSLAGDEDDPQEKVSGVFFQMMADSLPGTRAVELAGADRSESELETDHAEIHAFAGEERIELFVQSTEDAGHHTTEFDISGLVTGFDSVTLTRLGVAPGESPGSGTATPVLTELDPASHYDNGVFTVTLGPREIVQISISGADFTAELESALDGSDAEVLAGLDDDDSGSTAGSLGLFSLFSGGSSLPRVSETVVVEDTPDTPDPVADDPQPTPPAPVADDPSPIWPMPVVIAPPSVIDRPVVADTDSDEDTPDTRDVPSIQSILSILSGRFTPLSDRPGLTIEGLAEDQPLDDEDDDDTPRPGNLFAQMAASLGLTPGGFA